MKKEDYNIQTIFFNSSRIIQHVTNIIIKVNALFNSIHSNLKILLRK